MASGSYISVESGLKVGTLAKESPPSVRNVWARKCNARRIVEAYCAVEAYRTMEAYGTVEAYGTIEAYRTVEAYIAL